MDTGDEAVVGKRVTVRFYPAIERYAGTPMPWYGRGWIIYCKCCLDNSVFAGGCIGAGFAPNQWNMALGLALWHINDKHPARAVLGALRGDGE